jgi:thiol-disulfide isomerase/thioredoxin
MVRMRKTWAGGLALAGAVAALYVIPACSSKPDEGAGALTAGAMRGLTLEASAAPAPTSSFTDASGKSHTLAEFKGKAVVLNLWGTFCAPCVAEMPTLAKLASQTASQPVVVLPVSVDPEGERANAEAFLARSPGLPFYSDPNYGLAFGLKPPVAGLPTTILIDREGVVRARVAGGADWSGPDAMKVVEALERAG